MHFEGWDIWHEFRMARASRRLRRLWDTYSFAGFRAQPTVRGIFGDPKARVVTLTRRSKKRRAGAVVGSRSGWYDRKVRRVRDLSCGDTRIFLELEVRRVECRNCGKVKRERLEFLADNPFYTKRFAYFVGRRCRRRPSRTWPRNCIWTGTRSRSWRSSTCRRSSRERAARAHR